jgi:hypothetical protein
MTPEQLVPILQGIVLDLGVIMSFGLGGLSGIAFVVASAIKWNKD